MPSPHAPVTYRLLLWGLLAAALLLRLTPLVLPSLPDPDHYYHWRIAQETLEGQSYPSVDPFSYLGRAQTYYPVFSMLIASVSRLTGWDAYGAYAAFSLLVVALSILAVFSLSRAAFGSDAPAFYAALLYAFLPGTFIRSLAFTRPDSLALFLLPLVALLLLRKKYAVLTLTAAFLPLLHPFTSLICGALVVLYAGAQFIARRRLDIAPLAAFGIPWALAAGYYLRFPLGSLFLARTFSTSSELQSFQGDFILSSLGVAWVFLLVAVLERKRLSRSPHFFFSAWAILAGLLLLLATRNVIFLLAPVSLYAGWGFSIALKKSGPHAPVLWMLVAASVAGLAWMHFADLQGQYSASAVSAASRFSDLPAGGVVTAWDRGHLLTMLARRPVYMDGYFEFAPQLDARMQQSQRLFALPAQAQLDAFTAQHVSLVYLDGRFPFSRQAWPEFAARTEGISKVLDNGDTSIWEWGAK